MSYRKLSYTIFYKDKMTGRVDIWRIFEQKCKKVKIEVTGTEQKQFLNIFR